MNRLLIKLCCTLAPSAMTKFALDTMQNPQVRKLRDSENSIVKQAQTEDLDFEGFSIKLYRWGSNGKTVFLVHGWEGQAGNFASLIPKLIEQGFTVLAFDAPAHGFSSSGKTSMFQFTRLTEHLLKRFKPQLLVSHSFGAVALTYVLRNLPELTIDKYLLLTTPDKFTERINDIAQQVGISTKVQQRLIQRFELEAGEDIHALNISDFVEKLSVKKALILQDKKDRVLPVERARNVAKNWPVCELIELENTGHFKILHDKEALSVALDFLCKN
ncbi:MAG: alpha/beta fold hydrolase [Luteibaculaceae bacterium]